MKVCWIFLICMAIQGQDRIDIILDRNPFDPDRGKVEEEQTQEVEVAPVGMPVLEGTLLLGESHFAIFSGKEEGQTVSFRVPLNGDLNGYTVVNIDRNFVELKNGNEVMKLAMYTGEKEDRGGSKSSAAKKEPPKQVTRNRAADKSRGRDEKEARKSSEKPKPQDDDKKSSRFVRKRTPKADTEKKQKTNMKNKI